MTKLLITRINAYGLSSLLVLPKVYETQKLKSLPYIILIYITIYLITKYYKSMHQVAIQLLWENIVTVYSSYLSVSITLTLIHNEEIVKTLFNLLTVGLPISITIALVLFTSNYLFILIYKPTN